MKVIITTKNFNASDHLKGVIEKKLEKLGKYFSRDIVVNVILSTERGKQKIEATINARGMIFRAEEHASDAYEAVDRIVEKLSSQMSRFKKKLQDKHKDVKDNKGLSFADIPEYEESPEEIRVVKTKKFDLVPMTTEEAIMQMELLQHNFFVFLNMESDRINVVYKRNNDDYGLLETSY
ncbi:MAG: ribosome-associated translation inhibitor RaiA [Clostridiales bacterium]|nr:ribosome-associated translation inhibitor RaiA [Clostridiales bacterium]